MGDRINHAMNGAEQHPATNNRLMRSLIDAAQNVQGQSFVYTGITEYQYA